MKMTENYRNAIRKWLREGIYIRCPFVRVLVNNGCGFCSWHFPKIKIAKQRIGNCPCIVYGKEYVIKKAKKMLEK